MQKVGNPQNDKELVNHGTDSSILGSLFCKNYQPIEQLLNYTIIKTTKL